MQRYAETLEEQGPSFIESEIELTPEERQTLEETDEPELMGDGPWVKPCLEIFPLNGHGRMEDRRLFRWTMDYHRNGAVSRKRGLMDGVVDKDHHYREERNQ